MQNSISSNNRDVLDEWRLVYCPNNTILERLVTNAGSSLGVHPPYGVDNAEQLHSVMLFYKVIAGIEFHHPAVRSFRFFEANARVHIIEIN